MSSLTNADNAAAAISGTATTTTTTLANQSPMNRKKVKDLNDVITCILCRGYLVEPTTINECMHTFCRSCILKHLASHKHCPVCRSSKQILVTNLRGDKIMRSLVFKLVPDLYKKEVDRRKQFNHDHKIAAKPKRLSLDEGTVAGADAHDGDFDDDEFFSLTELISLSLTYHPDSLANLNPSAIPATKYLNCPAAITVRQLQKFLSMKFDLDMNNGLTEIQVIYEDIILTSNMSLIDVAYRFQWKRTSPMGFFYRIFVYVQSPLLPYIETNQVKPKIEKQSSEVAIEVSAIKNVCNNNKNTKTVDSNKNANNFSDFSSSLKPQGGNVGAGKRDSTKSVRFEKDVTILDANTENLKITHVSEENIKPVKLSPNSRRLTFTEDLVPFEPKTSSSKATKIEGKAAKQPKPVNTSPNNDFKSLRSNDIKPSDYSNVVVHTKADSASKSSRSGTVTANDSKYSSNAANNNNNNNNNTKLNSTKASHSKTVAVAASNVDGVGKSPSLPIKRETAEPHRSEAKYKRVEPNVRASAPTATGTAKVVSQPDRRFSFCEDDNDNNELSLTALKNNRKCTVKLSHSISLEEKCRQKLEQEKQEKNSSKLKLNIESTTKEVTSTKKHDRFSISSTDSSTPSTPTTTSSSSSSPLQQQVDLTEYAKNIGLKPICPLTEPRSDNHVKRQEETMRSTKKLEAEASSSSSHRKRKKGGKHSKESGSKRPKIHAQIKSQPKDLVMKLKIMSKEDLKISSNNVEENTDSKTIDKRQGNGSVKSRDESKDPKKFIGHSGTEVNVSNVVSKTQESQKPLPPTTTSKQAVKFAERTSSVSVSGHQEVSAPKNTKSEQPNASSSKPKMPEIRPITIPSNSPRHSANTFLMPDVVPLPRNTYTPPIQPNKSLHGVLKRSASMDMPPVSSKFARPDPFPSQSKSTVMMSPRPIHSGGNFTKRHVYPPSGMEETLARLIPGMNKPDKFYNSPISSTYTHENNNRKPVPILLPPSSISVTKMTDAKSHTSRVDDNRPALEIVRLPTVVPSPEMTQSKTQLPSQKSLPIYGPVNQAKMNTSSPKMPIKTTRPPPPNIPLVKIKKANATAANVTKAFDKSTKTTVASSKVATVSAINTEQQGFVQPPKKLSDTTSNIKETKKPVKVNDGCIRLDITAANTKPIQSVSTTMTGTSFVDPIVALDLSGKSSRSPSIENSPTNSFPTKQASSSPKLAPNASTKSLNVSRTNSCETSNTASSKKSISQTSFSFTSDSSCAPITSPAESKHIEADASKTLKSNRPGSESNSLRRFLTPNTSVSPKSVTSSSNGGSNKNRDDRTKSTTAIIPPMASTNTSKDMQSPRTVAATTAASSKTTTSFPSSVKSSSSPNEHKSTDTSNLKMLSESATNREKIKAATSSAYAALASPSLQTTTVALTSSTVTSARPMSIPKLNEINKIRTPVRPQQSASVRNVPNPSALAFRQQAASQALQQLQGVATSPKTENGQQATPGTDGSAKAPVDPGSSELARNEGKKREKNIEVLALKLGAAASNCSGTSNGKNDKTSSELVNTTTANS